ncbi:MAG TPA: chorismate-binding protein, partial [Polyangiales bacterium]|nr:chorismate-binding protein [Polyangiales bacterium]
MSQSITYRSAGGVRITRHVEEVELDAFTDLRRALDTRRGLLLASSYEYPGRYTRCDLGFVDPLLSLEARGRMFELRAHGPCGELLLSACAGALRDLSELSELQCSIDRVSGVVPASDEPFAEEARTRTPSVFTLLRRLRALFASPDDSRLGLYGAFGYDLVFQFESLRMQQPRLADARDLVLYLPDRVLVRDHALSRALSYRYEFEVDGRSTVGLASMQSSSVPAAISGETSRDHAPGEFARLVEVARAAFARGDLFEVTPSQVFSRACRARPSEIFQRLREQNPAPYGFLANLGEGEFLIGASPEMYVRVQGDRVETCPIAGTIARGQDALGDARQVQRLLASDK